MRKALLGLTPLIFSLAACSQSTTKPAPSAANATTTTTGGASHAAGAGAPSDLPAIANPITDSQVRELMELTGTDKVKDQLTQYIMRNIQQAPFMPKDVIDDMHTSLEKTDVNTAAAATYKKYLSTEDATTIIAFYKTPAGQDLVKVTPRLMSEVQRSAMQTGQQVAHDVIERHRPEIETAQKKYQAEHATPAAPSLGAPTPGAKTPASPAPAAPTKPQG